MSAEPPKHPVVLDATTGKERLVTQDDVNALIAIAAEHARIAQAIEGARAIKKAVKTGLN